MSVCSKVQKKGNTVSIRGPSFRRLVTLKQDQTTKEHNTVDFEVPLLRLVAGDTLPVPATPDHQVVGRGRTHTKCIKFEIREGCYEIDEGLLAGAKHRREQVCRRAIIACSRDRASLVCQHSSVVCTNKGGESVRERHAGSMIPMPACLRTYRARCGVA